MEQILYHQHHQVIFQKWDILDIEIKTCCCDAKRFRRRNSASNLQIKHKWMGFTTAEDDQDSISTSFIAVVKLPTIVIRLLLQEDHNYLNQDVQLDRDVFVYSLL